MEVSSLNFAIKKKNTHVNYVNLLIHYQNRKGKNYFRIHFHTHSHTHTHTFHKTQVEPGTIIIYFIVYRPSISSLSEASLSCYHIARFLRIFFSLPHKFQTKNDGAITCNPGNLLHSPRRQLSSPSHPGTTCYSRCCWRDKLYRCCRYWCRFGSCRREFSSVEDTTGMDELESINFSEWMRNNRRN